MMGGELDVESELGKGSTFKARIPGVATKCDRHDQVGEANPVILPKNLPKRVLVVDDSPVNRLVITAFLKKAGISSIDHAGDGGEALSKLDSARKSDRPYDFVFSDFWMPNMNGLELIEKLRADSRFNGLCVFAVTADTEYRSDDRSKLFSGVLLKPLTYAKLVDAFAAKDAS
jgi:CheY-like chemotaxis protein